MSELAVDTNQEEEQRNEQMQEEIDATIEEEMQEEIDAVIEEERPIEAGGLDDEITDEDLRHMEELDNEIKYDFSYCPPKGAPGWFLGRCAKCSCCEGYNWDCKRCERNDGPCMVCRELPGPVTVATTNAGNVSVMELPVTHGPVPDIEIPCSACKIDFTHTGERQALFEKKGWKEPTRCAKCNDLRKQGVGQPRHASSSTSVSVPAPGYASASVPAPVPDPVPVPAPVPDPVPVPVPVPDVVRTGPVTPENIGDIASGTPLYQGKNRKLLIVIRYNPDSGFIFLQDGEKPQALKMKLAKAGLFWDDG